MNTTKRGTGKETDLQGLPDRTLAKHIENGKVAPSYLLIDRDTEKLRAIAEWFGSSFNKGDIFWLVPKAGANTIQVKETEEFLNRTHLAAIGEKKLFIICDTSSMTPAAQNKTLKTLEDTTNDTFLLLASNPEPILNTIKSRCIIIYPDPSPSPAVPGKILDTVSKILFECKTLDDALRYVPELTTKDNFGHTLLAFNNLSGSTELTIKKRNAILKRLAIINRNIAANCNAANAFDSLLMEIFLK